MNDEKNMPHDKDKILNRMRKGLPVGDAKLVEHR